MGSWVRDWEWSLTISVFVACSINVGIVKLWWMLVLEGVGKTLHLGGFEKFSKVKWDILRCLTADISCVTTSVHSTDFHDPIYSGPKFLTIVVGPFLLSHMGGPVLHSSWAVMESLKLIVVGYPATGNFCSPCQFEVPKPFSERHGLPKKSKQTLYLRSGTSAA